MKLARTKNTIRNTLWSGAYRLVAILGPFVVKTIMIRKLGLAYSGLNSLFTDILTVLNLTNLGFSSALVFTLYRAVAEDDREALCAILAFFRKAYRISADLLRARIPGVCEMPDMVLYLAHAHRQVPRRKEGLLCLRGDRERVTTRQQKAQLLRCLADRGLSAADADTVIPDPVGAEICRSDGKMDPVVLRRVCYYGSPPWNAVQRRNRYALSGTG